MDILAEGELDLSDSVLEQMDLVIASVHSHFNQDSAQMTDRLLRAIDNPHTSIIGHPTGRMLLRREGYNFDYDKVFAAAAKAGVAMEHNAYPDRLDLHDLHLRMARGKGVKFVINTDAHHTSHMEKIRFGVLQLRRAWLTRADILNTLPGRVRQEHASRQAGTGRCLKRNSTGSPSGISQEYSSRVRGTVHA